MPLHAKFSARLTISIDPDVKDKIQQLARDAERSDADIVREALDLYLENRGLQQKSQAVELP